MTKNICRVGYFQYCYLQGNIYVIALQVFCRAL